MAWNVSVLGTGENRSNVSLVGDRTDVVVWNYAARYILVICVLVITLNGSVILSILNTWDLRTRPFYVYLLCLMTFNICYAATENPLAIINNLYPTWWLGAGWCRLYSYAETCISAGAMHTHALIAANRIWAVTFPLSYRNLHSKTVALTLCVLTWVYVHAVILPSFIEQIHEIHLLEVIGCISQYQMDITIQFVIYAGPELVVLCAFAIVCYKRRRRMKIHGLVKSLVGNSVKATSAAARSGPSGPTESLNMSQETTLVRIRENRRPETSRGFMVLTLLTITVVVCWTPATVAFLVGSFSSADYPTVFQVVITMFDMVPVLDPILLTIAMKDLRKAVSLTVPGYARISSILIGMGTYLRTSKVRCVDATRKAERATNMPLRPILTHGQRNMGMYGEVRVQ